MTRWVGALSMGALLGACAAGDTARTPSPFDSVGHTGDGTTAVEQIGGSTDEGTEEAGPLDTSSASESTTTMLDSGTDGEVDDGQSESSESGCEDQAELCDGLDNDCDGEIDEGFGLGNACVTAMPGVCTEGTNVCNSELSVECVPNVPPSAESCNGLDDDCDGVVDNGIAGVGDVCATGLLGVCADGTQVCNADGTVVVCEPTVGASAESCNGLDDDCNGTADDGLAGVGDACDTGNLGVCAAGTMQCDAGAGAVACAQDVEAAATETCGNGLDDDCDGVVDNGCACAHDLCVTGVALAEGCDDCVATICPLDPFCCNNSWDAICVGRVESDCMSAACVSPACAHPVCEIGVAMVSGCHPCVTSICAVDSFCCNNSWDSLCVGEVTTVCALDCP